MAPDDYTEFPPPEQLANSFTQAGGRQCFDVAIRDDTMYELEEQFTVTLIAQTNFSRVMVDPALATIIIEDDDSECSDLPVLYLIGMN